METNNVNDRGQLALLSDLTQALLAVRVTSVELPEQGAEPGPAPSKVITAPGHTAPALPQLELGSRNLVAG